MFEPLSNLLDHAFGAVVGGALTAVAALLARLVPAQLTWRFNRAHGIAVCVSTTLTWNDQGAKRSATGIGQVRALGFVSPSLARAYGAIKGLKVIMSDEQEAAIRESNLILLGGPQNNELTRDFLLLFGERLRFQLQEPSIIDTKTGEAKYRSNMSYDRSRVDEDYAIIVSAKNPYNEEARVVILAGTRTLGTSAAAEYFSRKFPLWRRLLIGDFVAVVRAELHDLTISKITRIELKEVRKRRRPAKANAEAASGTFAQI